jgi:hypothetical protein
MLAARTTAEERGRMKERGRGGRPSMAGRRRQQMLVLEEAREEGNPN